VNVGTERTAPKKTQGLCALPPWTTSGHSLVAIDANGGTFELAVFREAGDELDFAARSWDTAFALNSILSAWSSSDDEKGTVAQKMEAAVKRGREAFASLPLSVRARAVKAK
jgi:hypothetical protein